MIKDLHNPLTDPYIVRKAIKDGIARSIPLFNGTLLDIGCGQMPYKEFILNANPNIKRYIGLDFAQGKYAELKQPNITWDGKTIPLDDSSVDCAMATEVLEHCPEPLAVLKEIKRVLKPDGVFFFTVLFLWPLHDTPRDYYRYTPFSLERLLTEAGFEDIQIKAMGGWNASLAQMIGLWLKRAPMPEKTRKQVTKDLFPFYKQLIKTDKIPESFESNSFFPGLSGIAIKCSLNLRLSGYSNTSSGQKACEIDIENKMSSLGNLESISANKKLTIIQGGFPSVSATFILDQMTGLIERGFIIDNWATYDPKPKSIHPDILDYDLLSMTKHLKVPQASLKNKPSLWINEFVKLNQVDLDKLGSVHVHYGANFNLLEPLFKCVNNYILVSFHGYDASRYFKQHGDKCYNYLFKRANLITTPSYIMKQELVNRGCEPEKVVVHRYGIDLDRFQSPGRKFDSGKTVFLTVGRLVEKKGIEISMKAFSKICSKLNCEYRIIGEGELLPKLQNLANNLKISDKVAFLGAQNKDIVIREMRKADIFVLTSITASDGDQEGVPVSLTEAHAMGLPVISSYHSGIPELVIDGETGLLSEERDISSIAKNMFKLAEDETLRQKMSKNAVMRVQSEFNIEVLNDTLSTYFDDHSNQQSDVIESTAKKRIRKTELDVEPPLDCNRLESLAENLKNIGWSKKQSLYNTHLGSLIFQDYIANPSISIIVISWRLHPDTIKNFQILEKQRDQNF
ncbi:MAG: glycosyltransferase, partial [Bacteroidales bacterium]